MRTRMHMTRTTIADSDSPALDAALRKAGLHHVDDSEPGIVRRRAGKGFTYLGPDGKRVDAATQARIDALEAQLREREPEMQALARRVSGRANLSVSENSAPVVVIPRL